MGFGIGIGIGWPNASAGISYASKLIKAFKARVLSYPTSIFEAEACLDAALTELNAIGLLKEASLVITPNAYNEGILYDVVPNTTLGDMNVVRATPATRVNSAGLIESVGLNIPRIDYTKGSCPSLLIEPLRTNLVFPSATLTTQTRTVTAAANTLSFYGTGKIVLSGVHIATLTGTGANNRVSLTFTPTTGSLILTVTGTVTNAQLELGSYATSYVPTVASIQTRNADVISKTGISSLLNPSEGVFYIEAAALNQSDADSRAFNINDVLGANYVAIQFQADGDLRFDIRSGININRLTLPGLQIAAFNKFAISWGPLGIFGYVNGVKYVIPQFQGTIPSIPTILTRISFFRGSSSNIANSYLKEAVVFKTALTDTECIALTTL